MNICEKADEDLEWKMIKGFKKLDAKEQFFYIINKI